MKSRFVVRFRITSCWPSGIGLFTAGIRANRSHHNRRLADPSGAGVPGATLNLTNQDTAVVVQTQKSDASGNFSFQAVPAPANYSISVQASGFSRLEQKDIVLTAGERRSVGTLDTHRRKHQRIR